MKRRGKKYLEGGEPFVLHAGKKRPGVMVLHGFTGSPFEVRAVGELLSERGFNVFGPALAGHATHVDELERTTLADYLREVEEAYDRARAQCSRLYVIGLSMGGTLGLHLATQRPLPGLITISAPVFLYPMVNATVPLIEQWLPSLRAPANFAAWQGNVVGYKSTSIAAVGVLVAVMEHVRARLEQVSSPLLVVHSARDLTVPLASAQTIADSVSSRIKRLHLVDEGAHLMTVEPHLSLIGQTIVEFLNERENEAVPKGRNRA